MKEEEDLEKEQDLEELLIQIVKEIRELAKKIKKIKANRTKLQQLFSDENKKKKLF